jgi:hypothetical protein
MRFDWDGQVAACILEAAGCLHEPSSHLRVRSSHDLFRYAEEFPLLQSAARSALPEQDDAQGGSPNKGLQCNTDEQMRRSVLETDSEAAS